MNAFDIFVKLTVDTGDVEKGLTTAKIKHWPLEMF